MTKRRGKVYAILLLIGASIAAVAVCFGNNYRSQLYLSGRTAIVDTLNEQVNRTCLDVLNMFSDTDFVQENQYQDKSLNLSVNHSKVALLANEIVNACLSDLSTYQSLNVGIPLGAVTGSTYLADKGRLSYYTIHTGYTVETDFQITYQSVGINQVRYALYLIVKTTAHIVVPRNMHAVLNVSYIPVCEKVFSGEVPNVFVNGQDGTNYLDLVP